MNRQRQREREIQRQRERQQSNDMMTEGENYFFRQSRCCQLLSKQQAIS